MQQFQGILNFYGAEKTIIGYLDMNRTNYDTCFSIDGVNYDARLDDKKCYINGNTYIIDVNELSDETIVVGAEITKLRFCFTICSRNSNYFVITNKAKSE